MTKKILVFSTLIMLVFSMFTGFSYADEEPLLSEESAITNTSTDSSNITEKTTTSTAASKPTTIDDPVYKQSATVSPVNYSNLSEANLGLNNILCIILISVGVLLILFAIAILIRIR